MGYNVDQNVSLNLGLLCYDRDLGHDASTYWVQGDRKPILTIDQIPSCSCCRESAGQKAAPGKYDKLFKSLLF